MEYVGAFIIPLYIYVPSSPKKSDVLQQGIFHNHIEQWHHAILWTTVLVSQC